MEFFTLGNIADVVGLLGAIIGAGTLVNTILIRRHEQHEQERLDEKVELILKEKSGKAIIKLPGQMRRGEVTRAEVLGWVGMLPMVKEKQGKRFDIAYTNSAEFLSQLSDVQTGNGNVTFEIECTAEELRQFAVKVEKIKKKK
ncbi:MAG: hypothetical protein IT314_08950 [Anaerolineales bacterium]|nr:hypothetical protein [Anaerolineales bacterium]